jgi:hypothetical protein
MAGPSSQTYKEQPFLKKAGPRLTSPTPPPKSPVGGDRGDFTPPYSPNARHAPKAKRLFVAGILAGARILAVAPASGGDAVAAFRDDVYISSARLIGRPARQRFCQSDRSKSHGSGELPQ